MVSKKRMDEVLLCCLGFGFGLIRKEETYLRNLGNPRNLRNLENLGNLRNLREKGKTLETSET